MKILLISAVVSLLSLSFPSSSSSQGIDCRAFDSMTFDEFYYSDTDVLHDRLQEFEKKVLESLVSSGVVVVFASQQPQIDDRQKLISLVERVGTISKLDYRARIQIRFGGYRVKETFVFIFRPYECSPYSVPMADFTPDRVQFQGFSNATTHRHPYNELRKVALSSPVRSCPPAARAVRACTKDTSVDVFILVDQKGGVAFAEAIAAHPLLRSAAVAAVKEWRFTPLVIDGSSMNQAGIVKISFEEGPAILTNE